MSIEAAQLGFLCPNDLLQAICAVCLWLKHFYVSLTIEDKNKVRDISVESSAFKFGSAYLCIL